MDKSISGTNKGVYRIIFIGGPNFAPNMASLVTKIMATFLVIAYLYVAQ